MKNLIGLVVAMAALLIAPLSLNAQEKGKKQGSQSSAMVTQFLKQLEKAALTAEQTTKIKELYTKVVTEVTDKRTAGGLSADTMKKINDAGKSAREAGKKGKDLQAALEAAVTLTADQSKLLEDTNALLAKARVEAGKLLTAEQIAKLPETAQKALKEKAAGKKAKK